MSLLRRFLQFIKVHLTKLFFYGWCFLCFKKFLSIPKSRSYSYMFSLINMIVLTFTFRFMHMVYDKFPGTFYFSYGNPFCQTYLLKRLAFPYSNTLVPLLYFRWVFIHGSIFRLFCSIGLLLCQCHTLLMTVALNPPITFFTIALVFIGPLNFNKNFIFNLSVS